MQELYLGPGSQCQERMMRNPQSSSSNRARTRPRCLLHRGRSRLVLSIAVFEIAKRSWLPRLEIEDEFEHEDD